MYGDTAAMRSRVAQLREQGVEVRALADRLVAETEAISWEGRAAESMRTRMRDRAVHLRDCATRHDLAADALDRHVGEVDRLQDAIAQIQRRAAALVADARGRAAEVESHDDDPDGVRRELGHDDRALLAFTPPPSGHQAWLTVELPGL